MSPLVAVCGHWSNRQVEKFGRIDAAFNNAGIEGKVAPIAEITEDDFDAIVNTNLKGVYLALKYQIPQMLKQGGGTIQLQLEE